MATAFDSWSESDWVRHYAGPRFDPRAPKPGIWDAHGRLVPGNPADHPAVRARQGQSTGAILGYSQDAVRNEKIRVDAKYRGVSEDVGACSKLTNQERIAFSQQFDAWQRFYCGDEPQCAQPAAGTFYTTDQMQQISNFETTLYNWQLKLQNRGCSLSNPVEEPRSPEAPSGSGTLKSIETIAIAAAVIAGIFYVGPMLKGAGEAMSGAGSAARGIGARLAPARAA